MPVCSSWPFIARLLAVAEVILARHERKATSGTRLISHTVQTHLFQYAAKGLMSVDGGDTAREEIKLYWGERRGHRSLERLESVRYRFDCGIVGFTPSLPCWTATPPLCSRTCGVEFECSVPYCVIYTHWQRYYVARDALSCSWFCFCLSELTTY